MKIGPAGITVNGVTHNFPDNCSIHCDEHGALIVYPCGNRAMWVMNNGNVKYAERGPDGVREVTKP